MKAGKKFPLPKALRLLHRSEFRRVYEEGARRSTRLCTVFYRPNGLPQTRLGITTPSALGKAVNRNRIRRRLREVFRLNQGRLPGGWDVVLNPRPAVSDAPFDALERELLRLLPSHPPRDSGTRDLPSVATNDKGERTRKADPGPRMAG